MNKRGLGKGLSALLPTGGKSDDNTANSNLKIKTDLIVPNPYQPRLHFDSETLNELAQSIKEHGIVQPLALRKAGDVFQLIAGERRLRAAKLAGLAEVPAIVLELDERQMAEVSLIENIQRENLNPMEEAYSYYRLINEFNITQEDLAKRIGKSRSFVANMVRLVNLPDEIQQMVKDDELTAGHARCLLAINDDKQRIALAEQIVLKSLSVRQTEQLIKSITERELDKKRDKPTSEFIDTSKSAVFFEIEEHFRQVLGTKVMIKKTGENKGKIEIEYYCDEDLERIYELISKSKLCV